MIRFFNFSYFFIWCFSLNAQVKNDYRKYYSFIVSAKESLNSDSAIFYYQNAFKSNIPFYEDLLNCSNLLFNNQKLDESGELIKQAVLLGYQVKPEIEELNGVIFDYTLLTHDSIFSFSKFKNSVLSSCYDSLRTQFLNQCDQQDSYQVFLINEVYYQKLRSGLLKHKKYFKKKNNFTFHQHLSEPHLSIVYSLLRQNNFPERRKSKHFNSSNFIPIFLHCTSALKEEESKEFFDLLYREVLKGNILPYDYCLIYDYYYSNFIIKPKNTTTFGTIIKDGQILNVNSPEKLKKLREEYFLPSIESFALMYNYKLPKNYDKQ